MRPPRDERTLAPGIDVRDTTMSVNGNTTGVLFLRRARMYEIKVGESKDTPNIKSILSCTAKSQMYH
jgi:hypothetical protein